MIMQRKFGVNEPMIVQFRYLGKRTLSGGDFGVSFGQYPQNSSGYYQVICRLDTGVAASGYSGRLDSRKPSGAVAAYIRGAFDKVILPVFLFVSNFPAFGMAIILLTVFGINLKWFPTSGGYGFDLIPNMSWEFIRSVISHYQLPFWSIVLITIGGQAIGMRSMAIYELNADYVKYSRFLGIKDRKIVGYVFRNAMLPQITGLAMSLGTMMGGALVAEIIFSYPGIGSTLMTAVRGQDYPLISACTLIITVMVLLANLFVELIYGVIDPRVKAAQQD